MGDGGKMRHEAGGGAMLLDGHGMVLGVVHVKRRPRCDAAATRRWRCDAAEADNGGGDEIHAMWRSMARGEDDAMVLIKATHASAKSLQNALHLYEMDPIIPTEPFLQTQVYDLANGGDLIFERDLFALTDFLGRTPPVFYGARSRTTPAVPPRAEAPCGPPRLHAVRDSVGASDSRSAANHTRQQLNQYAETIKVIAKERRTLRQLVAKRDATIHRLKTKIAVLKETISTRVEQLQILEGEGEGEDIQGDGYSYVSNDNDYEPEEEGDDDFHQTCLPGWTPPSRSASMDSFHPLLEHRVA
ncbi:hypothetical protein QYE76_062671 [Lolium multiflorum]|uniref:Uncharacterized protein n=1 Tax=Lolium multiflorum TaxID=4521 RepID=A0AAD8W5V8_LOLMU|nr:hypothetical protein QYE76_062671 [Lolium multiflorum]